MMMKEKVALISDADAKRKYEKILAHQSELETLEMETLARLVEVSESSPEWAQIVAITGSKNRFTQARILAEAQYDKIRAEMLLNFYTPNKNVLKKHFVDRNTASAKVRTEELDALKVRIGAATSAVTGRAAPAGGAAGGLGGQ